MNERRYSSCILVSIVHSCGWNIQIAIAMQKKWCGWPLCVCVFWRADAVLFCFVWFWACRWSENEHGNGNGNGGEGKGESSRIYVVPAQRVVRVNEIWGFVSLFSHTEFQPYASLNGKQSTRQQYNQDFQKHCLEKKQHFAEHK